MAKLCEITSSVVKETKSRKEKGLSLWLLPKNRIQANLALWLEEGSVRESGRQIIGAQIQAYLPTSSAYVTLRNRMTPAWGEQQGRGGDAGGRGRGEMCGEVVRRKD